MTRGYEQYCGLARALDVVGDRWTLLIVRELLIGPRRFGELRSGLFGIATNLLSRRLRRLEADGVVQRSLGAPEAGTRYTLTPRGEALRPVVDELIRWSGPLMASGPGTDRFHPGWLAVALPALLQNGPARPVLVGLQTRGIEMTLEAGPSGAKVHAVPKTAEATIAAEPEVILGLAAGALTLAAAVRGGARLSGDRRAIADALCGGAASTAARRSRS